MFNRVLVANRGEVALRVIAACRELGLDTVAVCSTVDRAALHARAAGRAVCIGPPPPERSYLDVAAIVEAACLSGADAVHPGYGFLAESANLAEACVERGIAFVGPPPAVLRLVGDKVAARAAMIRAGVPVLPGADEPAETPAARHAAADAIGYPVIVKARGGGGGRGMRVAADAASLEGVWRTARREAQAAFGDPRLYLERYLAAPRHIE